MDLISGLYFSLQVVNINKNNTDIAAILFIKAKFRNTKFFQFRDYM